MRDKEIESIRDLDMTEYNECKAASSHLWQHARDQALFTIVLLNYADLEETLWKCLEEYMSYSIRSSIKLPPMEKMTLDINRRILNLLSSIRTFLDHSQTNLTRRYGAESAQVSRFKNACSNKYDNEFSYRFVYELRNYVQHCGMPVGTIELKADFDRTSYKVHHLLEILFDRDKLLTNFDWKPLLKSEISTFPPQFPVRPHFATMMRCIEEINLVLLEDDLPVIVKAATLVHNMLASVKGKVGTLCILKGDPTASGKTVIEWLPLEVIDRVLSWGKTKNIV